MSKPALQDLSHHGMEMKIPVYESLSESVAYIVRSNVRVRLRLPVMFAADRNMEQFNFRHFRKLTRLTSLDEYAREKK